MLPNLFLHKELGAFTTLLPVLGYVDSTKDCAVEFNLLRPLKVCTLRPTGDHYTGAVL